MKLSPPLAITGIIAASFAWMAWEYKPDDVWLHALKASGAFIDQCFQDKECSAYAVSRDKVVTIAAKVCGNTIAQGAAAERLTLTEKMDLGDLCYLYARGSSATQDAWAKSLQHPTPQPTRTPNVPAIKTLYFNPAKYERKFKTICVDAENTTKEVPCRFPKPR